MPHLTIALKFIVKRGTFFCSLLNRVSPGSLQLYQIHNHRKAVGGLSNAAPTVKENKSLTVLKQSISLVVLFKCGSPTGEQAIYILFKDLQSRILSNIDCLLVKVLTLYNWAEIWQEAAIEPKSTPIGQSTFHCYTIFLCHLANEICEWSTDRFEWVYAWTFFLNTVGSACPAKADHHIFAGIDALFGINVAESS